jgi:peptidoglycan/LPS O-acetylase OafA/YrhL
VYLVALLASYFVGSGYVESVPIGAIPLQSWIPSTASIQYWNAPGWTLSVEALFYVSFRLAIAPAASASDKKLGGAAAVARLDQERFGARQESPHGPSYG